MSPKRLFISGALAILLVNGSIFGTIYLIDWIRGPTPEEIKALEEAEAAAALEAVYAKLPPLPEFKSKKNNLRSIGEALEICKTKLYASVNTKISWEANMIESRYVPSTEIYKIFIEYETLPGIDEEPKLYKVTCEVSAETKLVDVWKADAL